jgi:DNA-binding transcriptional MerR regulator
VGCSAQGTDRRGADQQQGANVTAEVHQIGEVAEAVGLSLRTIRYYEEAGLAIPSGRSAGGFRLYTDTDIDRLRLIKNLKPLDLSIEEIRDLLTTRDRLADPTTSKSERLELSDRLAMFAALADDRCQRLRDQLEMAEVISRTLSQEARKPT